MSDSVFIDAFTRYGWVEECIDIDEVAYVDFVKGVICLKAHDAQIPRKPLRQYLYTLQPTPIL